MIAYLVIIIVMCGASWIQQYYQTNKPVILFGAVQKYSRCLFNFWNWGFRAADECKSYTRDELRQLARKCHDSQLDRRLDCTERWGTRVLVFFVELLVLSAGWVALVFLLTYSDKIVDKFDLLGPAAEYTFPLALALVNNAVSTLLVAFTKYEGWELSRSRRISKLIKSYAAQLLTLWLYLGVYAEFLLQKSYFVEGGVITPNKLYRCRQDQAGLNILFLAVTELLANILFTEIMNWLRWTFGVRPPRFRFEQAGIKLGILHALLCVAYLLCPLSVFLSPFIVYAGFYYQYYVLTLHRSNNVDVAHPVVLRLFTLGVDQLETTVVVPRAIAAERGGVLRAFHRDWRGHRRGLCPLRLRNFSRKHSHRLSRPILHVWIRRLDIFTG